MVGIPDGLGAHKSGNRVIVYMNHELTSPTLSEPVVGDPLNQDGQLLLMVRDRHHGFPWSWWNDDDEADDEDED